MRRWAAILSAMSVVVCSGCSGAGDRLTVYSGRGESLVAPVLERFSADTGIGIDVRYGDSADLALLIDEEGDNTPADVFYSQSPGATGYLADRDRLGQLPDEILRQVDERFRGTDGGWVGIT